MSMKSKLNISKSELQKLFDTSSSRAEILEKIGLSPRNLTTLKKYEKKLEINLTTFNENYELKFHKKVVKPGVRFSKLIVLNKIGKSKERINLWECQCDCGNTTITRSSFLRNGQTKSCGCYHISIITKFTNEEADLRFFYHNYINMANFSNKNFTLTFEDFSSLAKQHCFYCDSEPELRKNRNRKKREFKASGLDRINNDIGYHISNVVACCSICNSFKSDYDQLDFLNQVLKIAHKQLRK